MGNKYTIIMRKNKRTLYEIYKSESPEYLFSVEGLRENQLKGSLEIIIVQLFVYIPTIGLLGIVMDYKISLQHILRSLILSIVFVFIFAIAFYKWWYIEDSPSRYKFLNKKNDIIGYFTQKKQKLTNFYYQGVDDNEYYNISIPDSFASSIDTSSHFEVRNDENSLIKANPKSPNEPDFILEPIRPIEYIVKAKDEEFKKGIEI